MTDIVMSCHLGPSGISRAAQGFYKCLSSKGIRVVPAFLTPPTEAGVDKEIFGAMTSSVGRPYDPNPIHFFVGLPHALKMLKDRCLLIGSVVVEGNVLTPVQAGCCSAMDVVAVPSSFCKAVCLSSGVPKKKVAYLPYPLDTKKWNPGVARHRQGRFRFLWMNTWTHRKGWDVLLRAWWNEFGKDEPVELVIKSYRDQLRGASLSEEVAKYAKSIGVRERGRITTIDDIVPDEELPEFVAGHDAFVSPHRSEGFGMNPWYAMALGVPVIATDYSGTTDFVKADTGWPFAIGGMGSPSPQELSDFPHLEGTRWAEPDVNALRRAMRDCFSNREEREKRAAKGAAVVAEKYSPESVLQRFVRIVECNRPEAARSLFPPPLLTPGGKFESADKPFKMDEL